MPEIIINVSKAKITTPEVKILLEEPYKIKKGAEAPIIIVKENLQQLEQ